METQSHLVTRMDGNLEGRVSGITLHTVRNVTTRHSVGIGSGVVIVRLGHGRVCGEIRYILIAVGGRTNWR